MWFRLDALLMFQDHSLRSEQKTIVAPLGCVENYMMILVTMITDFYIVKMSSSLKY